MTWRTLATARARLRRHFLRGGLLLLAIGLLALAGSRLFAPTSSLGTLFSAAWWVLLLAAILGEFLVLIVPLAPITHSTGSFSSTGSPAEPAEGELVPDPPGEQEDYGDGKEPDVSA